MITIRDMLPEVHVLKGLPDYVLEEVAGCGRLTHFDAGAVICRTGEPADTFYAIREGRVSLEVAEPGSREIVIDVREDGDVVGWSWLFPPYRWHFDVTALELTRVIAFDGKCLRGKCDSDAKIGYPLMSRVAQLAIESLQATRLQLLDVYGRRAVR